ncbi:MAG: hypothetical protein IPN32_15845 [Deltaproteobacteria bacterium]|nr:hypothetical protein [Deltaproteobacteria bacterium]
MGLRAAVCERGLDPDAAQRFVVDGEGARVGDEREPGARERALEPRAGLETAAQRNRQAQGLERREIDLLDGQAGATVLAERALEGDDPARDRHARRRNRDPTGGQPHVCGREQGQVQPL